MWDCLTIYLVVLPAVVGQVLYPFGSTAGDVAVAKEDDVCNYVYNHHISMFGVSYGRIYVCTNGVISLDRAYTRYTPETFPLQSSNTPLICPFWADVDITNGGNVWSRESTDPSLLERASLEVRETFSTDSTYNATWLLIITWDAVKAFGASNRTTSVNTFQAVLVSDGNSTFAIFYYEDINWIQGSVSRVPAQVGFDSGDGVHYYATLDSQTPEIANIENKSNIGVPGKMMFKLGSANDTAFQGIQTPDRNLTTTTTASIRFTREYYTIRRRYPFITFPTTPKVTTKSLTSTESRRIPTTPLTSTEPRRTPTTPLTSTEPRRTPTTPLTSTEPRRIPTTPLTSTEPRRTPTTPLTSTEPRRIPTTPLTSTEPRRIPTTPLKSTDPILYPFGSTTGDVAVAKEDDVCNYIYNHYISIFGVPYSRIYVCTNGVISLDRTYTRYTPEPFPLQSSNTPLICPFWADVDIRDGGNVWSRESTDPSLLQRASLEVRNAFSTDSAYNATWLLIVTWDAVRAYSSSTTSVNTFQAVLVSDGNTAFTIFNYKDINWTHGSSSNNISAQVGFDSGDGVHYYATPDSRKPAIVDIETKSNVGVPGKMMFKLGSANDTASQVIRIPDQNLTTTGSIRYTRQYRTTGRRYPFITFPTTPRVTTRPLTPPKSSEKPTRPLTSDIPTPSAQPATKPPQKESELNAFEFILFTKIKMAKAKDFTKDLSSSLLAKLLKAIQ